MPWGQITPLRGSTLPVFTSGACWTLTELIELVENDSYWIAFSAGVFFFFFFFNWLDSQQCWMRCKISREGSVVLRGDGNGKEWESPCVRGSLNLGCAAGTALERQQGREEAVPGAVPLAEKMHFELVSLQGTSAWQRCGNGGERVRGCEQCGLG